MPNTPNRGTDQSGSPEQRKRQQSNDKSLQQENDDQREDQSIEAPGEDDEPKTLRTDRGGETGEDEDLPEGDTQVNRNPGNFANDREKARDAGRKGGER